jgi:hypothetical protein
MPPNPSRRGRGGKRPGPGKTQLHIDMPVRDHTALRLVAAARGQAMADIVRPMVMEYVRSEAARLGLDGCRPLNAAS